MKEDSRTSALYAHQKRIQETSNILSKSKLDALSPINGQRGMRVRTREKDKYGF